MHIRATILALVGVAGVALSGPASAQGDPRSEAWLAQHNEARAEFGVLPLRWSDRLASEAQIWASILARGSVMRHSSLEERGDTGENLWMGTAGYYTPQQMISHFIDEKQHFKTGRFPDVSTTGNWGDVGHYTQVIWPATKEVGCATALGGNYDYLVCRYYPAGNVMGRRIWPGRLAQTH